MPPGSVGSWGAGWKGLSAHCSRAPGRSPQPRLPRAPGQGYHHGLGQFGIDPSRMPAPLLPASPL